MAESRCKLVVVQSMIMARKTGTGNRGWQSPGSNPSDRGIAASAELSARSVTVLYSLKQTLHFPDPILLRYKD